MNVKSRKFKFPFFKILPNSNQIWDTQDSENRVYLGTILITVYQNICFWCVIETSKKDVSIMQTSKKDFSKRPKIGFQYQLLLNACQNYCRMLQGEHSAILLTLIKLPIIIKIFVLSFF